MSLPTIIITGPLDLDVTLFGVQIFRFGRDQMPNLKVWTHRGSESRNPIFGKNRISKFV